MIVEIQKNGKTELVLFGQYFEWRPSISIRNKYKTYIVPIINKLIELASDDLKHQYEASLYEILVERKKQSLQKLLETIVKIVKTAGERYIKEENIEFPSFTKEEFKDPLSAHEFKQLAFLSFALKLASPVIHNHKFTTNVNYVIDYFMKHLVDKGVFDKLLRFITKTTAASLYSRESMWNYLSNTIGINPEQFATITLNTFLRSILALYDVKQKPNIMSYLAGFVNQSLYYLFTDTYDDRFIQYVNIFKIKYLENYNLLKQEVAHVTFDKIANTIKLLIPLSNTSKDDQSPLKRFNIRPYDIGQKGLTVSPIAKYVTYPLISYVFNVNQSYFNEYKDIRYIETFMALVVEKRLKLSYLAKLMRSIVIDKTKKKLKVNRIKIKNLYKIKTHYCEIFKQKKYFDNIVQESKQYLYYDPFLHDIYILDIESFLDDLHEFYYMLLENKHKLDSKIGDIKKNFENFKELQYAVPTAALF